MSGKKKFSLLNSSKGSIDSIRSVPKRWYLFYLRPRAEKSVCNELNKRGYLVYCPSYRTTRVWKNRQKKVIELPLFPNYIFVHTYQYELHTIKLLPKVVALVTLDGKPAVVSEEEIEGIKRMIELEKKITVETRFSQGEHVRICSGPLTGYEGILIRKNGKSRFGIVLKAMNQTAFVEVDVSHLEKIKP